jgi:phosphate transport system permease protein
VIAVASKYKRRKLVERIFIGACIFATFLAILPLVSVLWRVVSAGLGGIDWSFFTKLPKPLGEKGGGVENAIVGTLILVGLACLIGVPVGVSAAIYLAEYGKSRLANIVRFCADVLAGIPSIVIGLFVYGLVVIRMHHPSALAGSVALAIIMLPVVARTTEEMLRLVPDSLREAGLALGMPRWRVIVRVIVPTALPGIATGVMLAVARIAGETAPLLFTAFNNRFFSTALRQPIGSMPVTIFTYADSAYDDLHRQANAAALVLVAMVLLLNITARTIAARSQAR